jgi:hypothetical protein
VIALAYVAIAFVIYAIALHLMRPVRRGVEVLAVLVLSFAWGPAVVAFVALGIMVACGALALRIVSDLEEL